MNIAFVNATKKWGGVKTWTLDVARELAGFGHRVNIYGRQPEFIQKAKDLNLCAERMDFGPDFNPVAVGKFLHRFWRQGTDLVVVNIGKGLKTAGVAAKLMGIPVVQRVGLPRDIALTATTKTIHAWIKPDFLVPCQYLKDGFVDSLPYITANDVKVVLNAKYPAKIFDYRTHRPRVIAMTSQLNKEKAHDQLLKALAGLDMDFKCRIIGTGTYELELRQLCTSLGMDHKVEWTGFSQNVQEELSKADIYALPSKSEGLPNALLEAMAMGLAPISRDVGGVKEVWPDGLDEFLLPPDADENQLKTALARMLSMSDEELAGVKEKAHTACKENFNLSKKARELESWFISLTS